MARRLRRWLWKWMLEGLRYDLDAQLRLSDIMDRQFLTSVRYNRQNMGEMMRRYSEPAFSTREDLKRRGLL